MARIIDEVNGLPQEPVLVAERVVDDRAARFGKIVIERDFQMPNGSIASFICVASPEIGPSILIFPLTTQRKVLLVNQFRFATNEWTLELPGGRLKPGQSWQEATKDELLEEVGAEVKKMKIIGNPIPNDPALQTTYFNVVLAKGCKVVKSQNLDSTEVMTVVEFSIKKFREMLKKGKITDAKTVAAGYLVLDHLKLLK